MNKVQNILSWDIITTRKKKCFTTSPQWHDFLYYHGRVSQEAFQKGLNTNEQNNLVTFQNAKQIKGV